ncbi:unnamed protein product [Clavelina lepadiformis]|uniref:CUB domain-containing protein n=1 Tax=Clavelina lepadiformis TaxID=159417 RepID=A0ABP0GFN1_CLALP
MGFATFLLMISVPLIQKHVESTPASGYNYTVSVDLQLSADDVKTFSTPGYPLVPYSNDASYEWRIQAPHDLRILITFIAGRTEGCCDRVQIVDRSETIGEFSGIIIPGTSRLSQTNSLRVIFSSDNTVSFVGFEIKIKPATCGGNIEINTKNSLELASDDWPKGPNNTKCFWVLYGRERKQIQLDFVEGSTAPVDDYIEVFDGLSSIGKLSGVIEPESFIAESGILILSYHSYDQEAERGFRASYKEAPCGFNANASANVGTRTISTPFYPSLYPNDLSCEWNLNAAADKLIELTFVESDTEDCCDFIQIIDGFSGTRQLSGKITPGLVFTSANNNLRLLFNSDSRGSGPGFLAVFREIDPSSNCIYSKFVGKTPINISSPLYPYIYHNNMSCKWTLRTGRQKVITINFIEVKTQECCDVIRIIENGTESLRLSGNTSLSSWTSKTNNVEVIFTSDSSVANKGFLASVQSGKIESVCHHSPFKITINSSRGYLSYLLCSVLRPRFSPARNVGKIKIKFPGRSIQQDDYIRVYNGEQELLKISGQLFPESSGTSTNNAIEIVIKVHQSVTNRAYYHDGKLYTFQMFVNIRTAKKLPNMIIVNDWLYMVSLNSAKSKDQVLVTTYPY